MNACAVTVRSRLAYARVLAESFLRHHPGASFSMLVIDGKERSDNNQGLVELTPQEIGFSDAEIADLALVCTGEELKSALIPRLLGSQIASEGASVLYFSDDTWIFAGLDDLEHLAKESGILLAPRTIAPLPSDGADPDAAALAERGIFDEGFVGVGPDAGALLEWWSANTGLQALVQASRPLAAGRLLEMMPAYFPAQVLGDRGVAVSFWNLWERPVDRRADGYAVGGTPLRTFHFDGFDPAKPHLLGPQGKKPRLLLSERPDLADLTRRYAAELEGQGLSLNSAEPYGFEEVAPGVPADDRIRAVYKKALASAFRGPSDPPPRPFNRDDPQAFVAWLNTPDPSSRVPLVSRYLSELYDKRVDLHFAFPGVA
ncbi:MAG: hypothetical protein ACRDIU_03450, partial [Actinomycetota bacterium]